MYQTEILSIPESLYHDCKNVTLCTDFFYVNGIPVFHAISRKINHRYISFPLSRSRQVITKEIKEVEKIYNARGFTITDIHADNEFAKVNNDLLPIRTHFCGANEHVPEVERSI